MGWQEGAPWFGQYLMNIDQNVQTARHEAERASERVAEMMNLLKCHDGTSRLDHIQAQITAIGTLLKKRNGRSSKIRGGRSDIG